MKDRFYNGFIAGFIGTLSPFVINLGTRALGLNTILWADFMAIFTLGRMLEGTLETAIFIAIQFFFLGILGAIFALILPFITSKHHLFKGALYGISAWFILFSLPHLLQIPIIGEIPFRTAIVHAISASLWGIIMALILEWLDNKVAA